MLSYVPCLINAALSNASPATQLEGISNKNAALNLHPPFAREFEEASQGDKLWGFLTTACNEPSCSRRALVDSESCPKQTMASSQLTHQNKGVMC